MADSSPNLQRATHKDGGFAWVVVIVSFLVCGLLLGTHGGTGLYIVEWVEKLNVSMPICQLIIGLRLSSGFISSVLWNPVLRRVDWRVIGVITQCVNLLLYSLIYAYPSIYTLIVIYGVLTSLANDLMLMTCFIVINSYFDKRRALANAIFVSGSAIGMFVWPPFITILIANYSWSGAILISAAIMLNGMPLMMLFRPIRSRPATPQDQTSEQSPPPPRIPMKSRLKTWIPRLMLCLGSATATFIHWGVITQTPFRAQLLGLGKAQGAYLVSVFGLVGGLTRVPFGLLFDKFREYIPATPMYVTALFIYGSCALLSTLGTSFLAQCLFAALLGLPAASMLILSSVSYIEIFGKQNLHLIMSCMTWSNSMSSIILMPFSGWMLSNGYSATALYTVFGCTAIAGSLIVATSYCLKRFIMTSSVPTADAELDKL